VKKFFFASRKDELADESTAIIYFILEMLLLLLFSKREKQIEALSTDLLKRFGKKINKNENTTYLFNS